MGKGRERFLLLALFTLALSLSLALLLRSQVAGDQLNLLARGWLLAFRGELIPYGNPLSTGGHEPGPLTSLLVGLPLLAWPHFRAPNVVIWLFHLGSWLLLDRVARRTLAPRERVLLAIAYGLSPWRLYLSGFLWNPNYLFLCGAVHLWSAWRQAERPSFAASVAQALAVGLAMQIHASFLLLAVASALLWWRGWQRLHWGGVATGGVLSAAALAPWVIEATRNPQILAAHGGWPGRGLLTVYPLLRGLLYWARYGSVALADRMLRFDFTAALGSTLDSLLAIPLLWLLQVAAAATLAASLAANAWLLRRRGKAWWARREPGPADRDWLAGYAVVSLGAAFVVYCLAPTTIMWWQGLPLFHAAVIPPVLWASRQLDGPRRKWALRGVVAVAVTSVVVAGSMAIGSPIYRCGGRQDERFALRSDSPMFDDLAIRTTCPWEMNVPGEWWPDVLPEEGRPAGSSESPSLSAQ